MNEHEEHEFVLRKLRESIAYSGSVDEVVERLKHPLRLGKDTPIKTEDYRNLDRSVEFSRVTVETDRTEYSFLIEPPKNGKPIPPDSVGITYLDKPSHGRVELLKPI